MASGVISRYRPRFGPKTTRPSDPCTFVLHESHGPGAATWEIHDYGHRCSIDEGGA